MIYDLFDIVIVPFPFTDYVEVKKRPALVCSSSQHFNKKIRYTVLAMITSTGHEPWPLDVTIQNLETAGLPKPSLIRMKLFTLDNRLIIKKIGSLALPDQKSFISNFSLLTKP